MNVDVEYLAEWAGKHTAPPWLSEFEQIAIAAVSGDSSQRHEGEMLLSRWVQLQHDVASQLVAVIRTTVEPRVLVVALLLIKTALLKDWNRSQEGSSERNIVTERLNKDDAAHIKIATMSRMTQVIEALIDVLLNRWRDIKLNAEMQGARNQLCSLIAVLSKKAWAHASTLPDAAPYAAVHAVLESALQFLAGARGLAPMSSSLSLRLLTEVAREFSSQDIAAVDITWDEYMDAKKLFEKRVMLRLVPELLFALQHLQRSCQERSLPLSGFLASEPDTGPIIVTAILECLEVFMEWEFSYTRHLALLQTELWFVPSNEWFPVMFGTAAGSTTTFFETVISFYRFCRSDPWLTQAGSQTPIHIIFDKMGTILSRTCQFRATRMAGNFDVPAADRRWRLTQMIYCPLASAVVELMSTSVFMAVYDANVTQVWELRCGDLAAAELQNLTLGFSRIVENVDIDIPTLMGMDGVRAVLETIEVVTVRLMHLAAAAESPDESIVASFENLTTTLARIAQCSVSLDLPLNDWVPQFSVVASHVITDFLTFNIVVCSLRESQDDTNLWDDQRQASLSVPPLRSPFVQDALKDFATIGRASCVSTASILTQCLKRRLEQFQSRSGDTDRLYDELCWTLGFASYFVVDATTGWEKMSGFIVPKVFFAHPDSHDPVGGDVRCYSEVSEIFYVTIGMLLESVESLPPSVGEIAFFLIRRYIDVYLLQTDMYHPQFARLTSTETGVSALSAVVEAVDRTLCCYHHEIDVCNQALQCLLCAASPEHPAIVFLWDCSPFRGLLGELSELAKPETSSRLKKLPDKLCRRLVQIMSSATSTSEHIRTAVRGREKELRRTGTLLTTELAGSRFVELTTTLLPYRDAIVAIGMDLSLRQQQAADTGDVQYRLLAQRFADPTLAVQLAKQFSVLTGLARGIVDHKEEMYMFLHPILEHSITPLAQSYMLYPDVLRGMLKFLYRLAQSLLSHLSLEIAKRYLLGIRIVIESFIEYHGTVSGAGGAVVENTSDGDMTANVVLICKVLLFILTLGTTSTSHIHETTWSPDIVMGMVVAMFPLLEAKEALREKEILLAYLNLLFQLYEQHPLAVMPQQSVAAARATCRVVEFGLASPNTRCKNAASEVFAACTRNLTNIRLQKPFVSGTSLQGTVLPPTTVSSEAFEIYEQSAVQVCAQMMISAIAASSVLAKDMEFFSDVLCDALTFLATRPHALQHVFEHLADLYAHEARSMQREANRSALLRAAEPIINHFLGTTQTNETQQTSSMQQIKYTQLRSGFRSMFTNLVVTCRLTSRRK